MQNGPHARSEDLLHTYSGERVSKVMFKSTLKSEYYTLNNSMKINEINYFIRNSTM